MKEWEEDRQGGRKTGRVAPRLAEWQEDWQGGRKTGRMEIGRARV